MLNHIRIKNFAIVDKLELDLESGLSVLTGETGAGKSILLDALGLALGDRADASIIRIGCERAEISAVFNIENCPSAQKWLLEHELDNDHECIIRRTINRNKPSKAYINGQPSPITALKQLGEMLVDLHSQHEHQSLLRKDTQRHLVDSFAGNKNVLDKLKIAYNHWLELKKEYETLSQQTLDRNSRLDLLRFQVSELETLNLQENELEDLDTEHRRLANSSQLLHSSEKILAILEADEQLTASSLLHQSIAELSSLTELDSSLNPALELLNSASLQVKETIDELRHYQETTELNPRRLEWIEQRLAEIHALSRKHHIATKELITLLPQLTTELSDLEHSDVRLGSLEQDITNAANDYLSYAKKLTKARNSAASKLSKQVTERMQSLGMEGGQFVIMLQTEINQKFSLHGMEKIEFQVTANPGQPIKSLNKVASGGELSRISLAIQVIAVEDDLVPTLIFDEVDVGIGGRVAEIVGRQLRQLANHRQVICVTHLPQVAALGHNHLQVNKQTKGNTTSSQIQPLDSAERIDEIARMLGGIDITQQTLSHAKEMIDNAELDTQEAETI
ncbi:DNA repair protein RecN [hydrothermal vent metagenome]|uniref:DNA repair protein RecN n=1 Tax=hydrothermal vent metagenome TaxID=652676 RepID=A0A3B1A984_9ZZZZ